MEILTFPELKHKVKQGQVYHDKGEVPAADGMVMVGFSGTNHDPVLCSNAEVASKKASEEAIKKCDGCYFKVCFVKQ